MELGARAVAELIWWAGCEPGQLCHEVLQLCHAVQQTVGDQVLALVRLERVVLVHGLQVGQKGQVEQVKPHCK